MKLEDLQNIVGLLYILYCLQPGGQAKRASTGAVCSGRLLCDVKISATELVRCRSYDLTELVSSILKEKRVEVDVDQIRGIFK